MTQKTDSQNLALIDGDLSLAPFFSEHITDEYLSWINDPEVMAYTEARWMLHTSSSARSYVEASHSDVDSKLFRILYNKSHVGNMRISDINYFHNRAELALIIGRRDLQGKGIGCGAIKLAAQYCFNTLSLRKVCCGIYANNIASIKAFKKADFYEEARLKDHARFNSGFVDIVKMARFSNTPEN